MTSLFLLAEETYELWKQYEKKANEIIQLVVDTVYEITGIKLEGELVESDWDNFGYYFFQRYDLSPIKFYFRFYGEGKEEGEEHFRLRTVLANLAPYDNEFIMEDSIIITKEQAQKIEFALYGKNETY